MIRILDIFFASVALLVFAPVLCLVAIALLLTGEHEIFYVQDRVGRSQKTFGLIKFATMLKNSPNMGTGNITIDDDPRVLPLGRILRKTKINELPQLINVMRGDMSLIGPRPLTSDNFCMYSVEARARISSVRPGLSGVGSIVFRDEEALMRGKPDPVEFYRSTIAPYKAEVEEWFVRHQGLALYSKCIVFTLVVVACPGIRSVDAFFPDLPGPSVALQNAREGI